MKFQVSKQKILQAVDIVKAAVANRTTNPILKTIYVEAGEDGWLTLRATNNILDISTQIPADIEEPGKVCISDLVISLLPTFEDGIYKDNVLTNPVKFVVTSKGDTDLSLTVTQGKRKHRPVVMPTVDFPKRLEITDYEELKESAQLIESFQRLNVAVGVTEDRRILQGFHLNPHLNMMVTGDGTRVYLRENITLPGNIANPPAKLIMSVLSNLTGLTEKDKLEVKSGPNPPAQGLVAFKATQFANDEPYLKWEIIVNGLDGEFPTKPRELIQGAMAQESKLKVQAERQVLVKILQICKVYSDRAFDEGKSTHTILTKNGSGITFSMHVPDLIQMEEPLECQFEGDDFKYLFHPGLALEALNTMKSETVELRFYEDRLVKGEMLPSPFIVLDGSEFTYLQGAMKQSNKKGPEQETKEKETKEASKRLAQKDDE